MKPKFISQAAAKGHPEDKLKIWKDWEAFAEYAFNKSHSTLCVDCLSNSLFKSQYPAEYMAAVLSNNMSDIKQVSFFMEECKKRMGLEY
jgi:DNA polymerase-3 subunit alpha